MRVAIMQPYFIPYLGYFRLLAAVDLFVAFDCVQFPRRGWVHRNQLRDEAGQPQWLTLPLDYAPQDTSIDKMAFPAGAADELRQRMARFPVCRHPATDHAARLLAAMTDVRETPARYIGQIMSTAAEELGIGTEIVYSSTLEISPDLKGQERILGICELLGAKAYVNAPGGRDLYDPAVFSARGIELSFLPEFQGNMLSVLQRFSDGALPDLRLELRDNLAGVSASR